MHFKSKKYDYVKYNGNLRASQDSFQKRNDKHFFTKLYKKFPKEDDLKMLMVANFLYDADMWIGKLFEESAQSRYHALKSTITAITYTFEQDVDYIVNHMNSNNLKFNDLIKYTDDSYPILMLLALQEKIKIETLIILDDIFNLFSRWDDIDDSVVWPTMLKKCIKYKSFLGSIFSKEKKEKYKNILRKKLL